ncbi:MAG TPA: tRNA 2-thiouridine(34) synthase MnmA [Acidimicrobiia bacterium]|nr:tRNA 2-thiouridine(34) synthase MnmA [Acidimicrobiia bacterium]
MRVMVAMSGGVDSSVAAAMMVEQGHEVIGATLKLWAGPNGEAPTAGCCTVSDSEDARRVAAQLDIPYYVLDYTEEFMSGVVDRFIGDYFSGLTPNPCIECNREVKFSRFLEQAAQFDCDVLVTGHYARTRQDESGWHLLKGVDPGKDQSYVLYMLGQAELERVRFPVGEQTKAETRLFAERLGLRTAAKPDSQDICFVGDGNYRDFLRGRAVEAVQPGVIVDTDGRQLGTHAGVIDFTIGQRKGLGVALGEPRYVVDIEPSTATITLGRKEDLETAGFTVESVGWVAGVPPPAGLFDIKVRYKTQAVAGTVVATPGGATVEFAQPQAAIAPGQAAVFYRGDEVVGGGTIVAT